MEKATLKETRETHNYMHINNHYRSHTPMNVAQHILAMLLLQVLNQNKYIKHRVVKSKSCFFRSSIHSAWSVNLKVCWIFVQEKMLFELCCEWFIWFSTISTYKLSSHVRTLEKENNTLLFKVRKKTKKKKTPSQLFYMQTLLAKNHSQYSSWTATSYND